MQTKTRIKIFRSVIMNIELIGEINLIITYKIGTKIATDPIIAKTVFHR